ncbi:hypothetical protein [Oceanicoccus sp. KOV_DT_Chl]|nr:hypothetical protein [Oceanicoccus sp. KOV_DT_Chl]
MFSFLLIAASFAWFGVDARLLLILVAAVAFFVCGYSALKVKVVLDKHR